MAYDSLSEVDISNEEGYGIEDFYGKNIIYSFTQKIQKRSLLWNYNKKRVLSDPTHCIISGNEGTLDIDGIIDGQLGFGNSIHKDYSLKTMIGKNALCTLDKEKGYQDATLSCTIKNPGKKFYITNI